MFTSVKLMIDHCLNKIWIKARITNACKSEIILQGKTFSRQIKKGGGNVTSLEVVEVVLVKRQ